MKLNGEWGSNTKKSFMLYVGDDMSFSQNCLSKNK